jgi:hypothetical protein
MPNDIIQISAADVSAFAKEVDKAINESIIPEGGLDLCIFAIGAAKAAQKLSLSRMATRTNAGCGVSFKPQDIEYIEWAMGLLLMARSVEIMRRKTRDTHCYVHKKPCSVAGAFNKTILKDCIDSFEVLLGQLKSKPLNDPD